MMTLRLTTYFLVLLPLTFALSISTTIDLQITRILIIILFLALLIHASITKTLIFPRGFIAISLLTFLVWSFFSLFYTPVPGWTLRKIFFFLSFAPLFVIFFNLLYTRTNGLRTLIHAILYGGFIASIIGIMQFSAQFIFSRDSVVAFWSMLTPFFLGGTFSSSVITYNSWYVHVAGIDVFRAIAFFPDPHVFAFYTGMIVPFAIGCYRTEHKARWLFIGIIIILGNLLTFSRGGEVGLLAGVFVTLLLLWPHLHLKSKHFFFGIALIISATFATPLNPVTDRILSSFNLHDTSNTIRLELWSHALTTTFLHPISGVGLGAYAYTYDHNATYRTPIYAHNLYLDIAVELGLIGLLLFLIIVTRCFWVFWIHRDDPIALSAIISMSIFFTHSFFDTAIFSVHTLPVLIFIFSLATYYEVSRHAQQKASLHTDTSL